MRSSAYGWKCGWDRTDSLLRRLSVTYDDDDETILHCIKWISISMSTTSGSYYSMTTVCTYTGRLAIWVHSQFVGLFSMTIDLHRVGELVKAAIVLYAEMMKVRWKKKCIFKTMNIVVNNRLWRITPFLQTHILLQFEMQEWKSSMAERAPYIGELFVPSLLDYHKFRSIKYCDKVIWIRDAYILKHCFDSCLVRLIVDLFVAKFA